MEKLSAHPYRDPRAALEAASQRVHYRNLKGADDLAYFLRHSIDDGTMLAAIHSMDRSWLADRVSDLEHNSRLIRDVVDPMMRALRWLAVSILSYAVIGALLRLHHGGVVVSVAVGLAVFLLLIAERCARWNRAADVIDQVADDLRTVCREKDLSLPEDLHRAIEQDVVGSIQEKIRVAAEEAARKIVARQPQQVRVDAQGETPQTPDDVASHIDAKKEEKS